MKIMATVKGTTVCLLHGAVEVMWGFDLMKGGQQSSLYGEVMFELRSESRVDLK